MGLLEETEGEGAYLMDNHEVDEKRHWDSLKCIGTTLLLAVAVFGAGWVFGW